MEVSPTTSRFPCSCLLAILFLCVCPRSLSLKSPIYSSTLDVNETDRLALLDFKDQITHYPFGVLNSWNDSLHFCQWQGVTCGLRHRRVRVLDLEGQQLVGTLSPFIGNLSFLRMINLQNNSLHGEIPQQVGHLLRLQFLFLNNNSFQGEIPANLSYCTNLRRLRLSYNNLQGKIPAQLGNLSKLGNLSINFNFLTGGIPSSIGNISSLILLSLGGNNLEGVVPDSLGQLIRLEFLSLGPNELSGTVPPSIYNISSLIRLSFVLNKFHGSLPPDFGLYLPNLRELNIAVNDFSGTVPVSLSNVSLLERIGIGNNNFNGKLVVNFGGLERLWWLSLEENNLGNGEDDDLNFLTTLTNCSKLIMLDLSFNGFGGVLPGSITNFSNILTQLLMRGNKIFGNIPTGIENLVNLELLGISENLLTGTIPPAIGKLQQLKELSLAGNGLLGQIPLSIGNLTQLFSLDLSHNQLNGNIPSSLGNCKFMQFLQLSQNNLDGIIPKQIVSLSSLSILLDLSNNSLAGSLPSEVGNLKSLGFLDISRNNLSGEIPSMLGDCYGLEKLYMEGNSFQGNIPSSLSSLKAIQVLDLSRNNLTGRIPKYLQSFLFLQNLNLSFNNFEGEVPKNGVFQNATAISVAENNKLCGGILELQLPACSNQKSKNQEKFPLRIIITIVTIVVLGFLMITFFLIYYQRRMAKKNASSTFLLGEGHLRISYNELLKATDGFALVNLIGVGSFGSVYKGILKKDGRPIPVAVKVLNLQLQGASNTFMAECKALRNIRHRNLLKIITSCSSVDFEGNDFKALVFEFMPNDNLETWLHPSIDGQHQSRYLDVSQRLSIAIDVACALDYLHKHCPTPIVHCDLKPSNILLDANMTAHVGDFGLVKFLSRVTSNSGEGHQSLVAIKGTIGYVPPEYGTGDEVSTKGDVYSYGILLLEMFTGKRPTHDMFKDGLSLHNLSKMAFPERVMEIIDSCLLSNEAQGEPSNGAINQRDASRKIQECLVSIIRIGVACSVEVPSDRMDISDVVTELHSIKKLFLVGGIHGGRQLMK